MTEGDSTTCCHMGSQGEEIAWQEMKRENKA